MYVTNLMTLMAVGNQAVCRAGQCTMPVVYCLPSMRLGLAEIDIGTAAQICFHVPRKSGKNPLKRQGGSH